MWVKWIATAMVDQELKAWPGISAMHRKEKFSRMIPLSIICKARSGRAFDGMKSQDARVINMWMREVYFSYVQGYSEGLIGL